MPATRLHGNPIVTPASHPSLGENINGPSLIRVPDWVTNPLGRYYLYFAHHGGKFIRMAYSDRLEGPWRVHMPGVLPLDQSGFENHIASPDVHVDHERHRIVMYYHGVVKREERGRIEDAELNDGFYVVQRTRAAESSDGLSFTIHQPILAAAYLRVWRWRGKVYGLAMPNLLYRAENWFGPFERGPLVLQDRASAEAALHAGTGMVRHNAVRLVPGGGAGTDRLEVYFSRSGDTPERILMSTIDLHDNWSRWVANDPVEVIRPEREWEGADCEQIASKRGAIRGRAWQLRDPGVFEEDGRVYLIYSIAGEFGLAIAQF